MEKDKLAVRAAKGDEAAFTALMDSERHRLYRIASAYLGNEADALEAIQEAVCRAWLKRRDLRQPEYMTTWLIRILIRVCADELQRRRRLAVSDRIGEEVDQRVYDEMSDEAERRLDMAEALQILEHPYRDVILLKYQEDMTLTEIAKVMNKPSGTVKTWLHRALEKLRCHLKSSEKGGDTHEEKQYGS